MYKVLQGAPFIHNWHQQQSYYRLQKLVNICLSLAISFKPGILCSLKMLHLYHNMLEIHLLYLYIINTVNLVGAINSVNCIVSTEDAMGYLLKETTLPLGFFCLVALWVETLYNWILRLPTRITRYKLKTNWLTMVLNRKQASPHPSCVMVTESGVKTATVSWS